MSLMHLLSVGRTFGEVREKPAGYRVVDGGLPEFSAGGEEPDFSAGRGQRVDAETPPPAVETPAARKPVVPEKVDEAPTRSELADTWSSVGSTPNVARPKRPAYLGFQSGLSHRWNGAKNRRRGVEADPAQRELSLHGVQVVRNDLRNADLELVRSESRAGTAAADLPLFSGRLPATKPPTVLRRLLRWLNPQKAGV